ncbi:MAG TPA: DEAD/DEAH box helicase [Sumerlaeia bacterium]|nr:DEAD/DEAH box helicase [Sumerlaeia bacterium]
MPLRPYQLEAVRAVRAALNRRPVLVAPTGSGKTIMGVALVQALDVPTLWLAHRTELIDQAAEHLTRLGLWAGKIIAGHPVAPLAKVQVASVQTLVRRSMPPAGLIVVDECHHAAAGTYGKILDHYQGVPVVGLTATPFRLDGRGLGDVFGEIVVAAYTDELVQAGYLHLPRVFAGRAPDLRGAKVRMGDYAVSDLAARTNTTELTGDIVATWLAKSAGRRTVVFAVNVEHSQAVCEAFQKAGVAAEHLDGKTPKAERAATLGRLRDAETLVVSNCMVLTEGWDMPALETAIIARPTASLNLHLQMIGRIMRRSTDKDGAIVLDHAGNHHVHGLVTRRIAYSLDGRCVGESDPLGLRRCEACQFLFSPSATECPECGWAPPPVRGREIASTGDGLVEYQEDFEYRAEVWRLIEAERQAMEYAPGWSAYRYHERFGVWPVVADGELVDGAHATMEQKRAVYAELLTQARAHGYRDGWASHKYHERFGVWPTGFVRTVKREAIRQRFEEART